jgi:hypothetical protein
VTEQNELPNLEELNLSVRARRILTRLCIFTTGALLATPISKLMQGYGFGATTLADIQAKLGEHGLQLSDLPGPAAPEPQNEQRIAYDRLNRLYRAALETDDRMGALAAQKELNRLLGLYAAPAEQTAAADPLEEAVRRYLEPLNLLPPGTAALDLVRVAATRLIDNGLAAGVEDDERESAQSGSQSDDGGAARAARAGDAGSAMQAALPGLQGHRDRQRKKPGAAG